MEQNRLKELILSIRNNKHRLEEKVSDLALAIEDKGIIDADTHELAELIKDTFSKRKAKVFYVDLLSLILGEPESSNTTPVAKEAPTFRSITTTDGVFAESTYTLGNPITCDMSNLSLPIDPYIIFLTDEEAQKFSVSVETNVAGEPAAILNEALVVCDIPNDNVEIAAFKGNCTKMFYGYTLGALNVFGLGQNEYIRVIITYDGVDYVYQS